MADKREAQKPQTTAVFENLAVSFGVFAVCIIAATFMRLNNVGMAQRRETVIQTDKTGDKRGDKGQIFELQRFVTSHMNANMGVVYLENQYRQRLAGSYRRSSGVK